MHSGVLTSYCGTKNGKGLDSGFPKPQISKLFYDMNSNISNCRLPVLVVLALLQTTTMLIGQSSISSQLVTHRLDWNDNLTVAVQAVGRQPT